MREDSRPLGNEMRTLPQVWAAGQQAMPPEVVYFRQVPPPAQQTEFRPGPQLAAAEQQALPLQATLVAQVCTPETGQRRL